MESIHSDYSKIFIFVIYLNYNILFVIIYYICVMMTTKVTKKGLICMQQLDETDDYMQVESKDKRF